MLHDHLDSRFLFPNPLLPLGEFLVKFSEQSLFAVSVRGLENSRSIGEMKVIMLNEISGAIRGFKGSTEIGMTIPEVLANSAMSAESQAAELKAMEENDEEAIHNNCQASHNQVTLDSQGFVRIFQRVVTPLSGYNGKVIALSATSLEVTQYTSLLHLLELYKKYYRQHPEKEVQAVKKFSDYLKLDPYFVAPLTLGEVTTLLAMAIDARHKRTAELIALFHKKPCTAKTISTYTGLIQSKLMPGITIHMVLRNLRDYYQLQPMLFEQA